MVPLGPLSTYVPISYTIRVPDQRDARRPHFLQVFSLGVFPRRSEKGVCCPRRSGVDAYVALTR